MPDDNTKDESNGYELILKKLEEYNKRFDEYDKKLNDFVNLNRALLNSRETDVDKTDVKTTELNKKFETYFKGE